MCAKYTTIAFRREQKERQQKYSHRFIQTLLSLEIVLFALTIFFLFVPTFFYVRCKKNKKCAMNEVQFQCTKHAPKVLDFVAVVVSCLR